MLEPYHGLDRMLEEIAVVAWDDLVHAETQGLVHIKYRLADNHTFANLQVWASETRGHWLLVCEYSGVASDGSAGLVFSNGYRSELLTHFLSFVIEHRKVLSATAEVNRDNLIQIQPPDEAKKLAALKFVNETQTTISRERLVLANAS